MAAIVRRVINTAKAPAAIGPYSQAVLVNSTLYVSGQLGLVSETMQFVSDDVQAQAKQALQNMGHILEAAGTSFDKVVKTTVLLADINDFAKVNEIYGTFFKEPYPARAAYQCANLPKLARVEIEAIAVVGDVVDAAQPNL
ncbi:2-iminobutanoate/2-iminopropanoate deaminase-like [Rhopilema esculentum]|uniref:2-iminobutanoate/2-iminopropanoate deaminase-like n=1 Tax=Rhopilema esculentum TaxID=499914 RepID=UPI0031E470ED|eukprot:gene7597-13404_t